MNLIIRKKRINIFLSLWVAVTAMLFVHPQAAFCQDKKISIIVKKEVKPYEMALEGFKQILQERGVRLSAKIYDIKGEGWVIDKNRVLESQPDIILSFGVEATELIKSIDEVPVVFSMVLQPVKEGFVESMEKPAGNITGVSLDLSIKKEFEIIKKSFPQIRRIAVIYDPAKSDMTIKEAQAAAVKTGMQIITKPVHSSKEIIPALEDIKIGVDAILAIPDTTVYAGALLKHILLFSFRNKVPIIGFSDSFAKAGALMSIYTDYTDVGKQTAELTMELLKGSTAAFVSVKKPRLLRKALNLNTARIMGIQIDKEVQEDADKVYE